LTKAQTLFIPALLVGAWWVVARQRGRLFSYVARVAIPYAGMAVVILPWTVRNYMAFNDFVFISTNGRATLLTGNNPSASGGYNEKDALVKQVPHDVAGQVANDRLAGALAIRWIRDNPVAFAALVPRKIWRLWAPDGEAEWSYEAGFKGYDNYSWLFRILRDFNQAYYIFLLVFFALSAVCFLRRWDALSPYAVTGFVLAAYFTLISVVFSGQSRFHFPLMPWVAMYTAWTITLWRRCENTGRGPVAIGT